MKTFKEFMSEALRSSVVQAAARQRYSRQGIQKKVGNTSPRQLSFTRLYHGTNKPASQAISKGGWRTDVNVTRKMEGDGVYTTPQKPAAQMYANERSNRRGGGPAVRTFRIPTSTYNRVKAQRQQSGKWDFVKGEQKFNTVQMDPKGANRYDITDKPKSAINFSKTQRRELNQRISSGLKHPKGKSTLKQQIKSGRGGSSTLSNVGRGVEASPSGLKFTPGTGGNYGISGIGLAN